MVAAKEISLALPGALRLAGKAWGSPTQSNLRVLAVHGWMDNANSFDRLGPALASASTLAFTLTLILSLALTLILTQTLTLT